MSQHANLRCAQRNIRYHEILFIVLNTKKKHNAGVIFHELCLKDIPKDYIRQQRYRQLIGTTVILCSKCERCVVTLYRNPEAFRKNSKKSKYDNRPNKHSCPCCGAEYLPDAA